MSNLSIRRDPDLPSHLLSPEPTRWLRDLLSWDPFKDLSTPMMSRAPERFSPSFDVKETKDAYVFRADVPGVKESDLEVNLTGNRMTVSGRREAEKEEKNETYYAFERSSGSFMRSFTLPQGVDVDHVKAELKAGVLTIAVPKLPEVQPKKIAIQGEKVKA
jgi:HSP20 family protein